MADSFFVTSSAVGVVLLGNTVCQGLYESRGGWNRALDALSSNVKDGRFTDAARTHVENFIADCSETVQHLARELYKTKIDALPSSAGRLSMKAKLSNASMTLHHPFRENTWTKLRGFVEEVRENLTMTMDTAQLYMPHPSIEQFVFTDTAC
jgi:hypothetical protein